MTHRLNDLALTECIRQIHRFEAHLDRHVRDYMESALFLDLMLLQEASKKAMERLIELKGKPPLPAAYLKLPPQSDVATLSTNVAN